MNIVNRELTASIVAIVFGIVTAAVGIFFAEKYSRPLPLEKSFKHNLPILKPAQVVSIEDFDRNFSGEKLKNFRDLLKITASGGIASVDYGKNADDSIYLKYYIVKDGAHFRAEYMIPLEEKISLWQSFPARNLKLSDDGTELTFQRNLARAFGFVAGFVILSVVVGLVMGIGVYHVVYEWLR